MEKKPILISLIGLIVLPILGITGCGDAVPEIPRDPFTTTWNLGDEGRKFSVSGDSAGHTPGESSEFMLSLDNMNGDDPWEGEYCVLLIDNNGIVKEVTHQQINVPVGLETQSSFNVEFPENYEGPLGLCVVIPERSTMITTIWVGSKNGNAGPWPNVTVCPRDLTEEGSREAAEEFVKNSPTFLFDGNLATLELAETLYPDMENTWQFVFRFESSHAGYGDRTGQVLAQVITPHEAIITIEQGKVKSANMDEKWDMINQKMLDE